MKTTTAYVSAIIIGITTFFIAKKMYSNSFNELDKDELIDQLMKLDKMYNKLGSMSGLTSKEEYSKYSKKQLIDMINNNIKSTSLGIAENDTI